jgi:tetratricopeptide (TPR) repeat protein
MQRDYRKWPMAALLACALVLPAAASDLGGPFDAELAAGTDALKTADYPRAEQHLRSALQMLATAYPDDPRIVKTISGLVTALRAQRKYAESEPLLERRMAARKQPVNPHDAAKDLRDLGQVAFAQKKFEIAQKYFQQEAEILQRRFGIEYPALATAWLEAASAALARDNGAEAEQLVAKAAAILDRVSTGDYWQEHRIVGDIYSTRQKWAEAELAYTKGIELLESVDGLETISSVPLLDGLATVYQEQGNALKAEAALLRLLSVKSLQLGTGHLDTAPVLERLASVYRQARRYEEAASMFERAHEIRRNQGDQAAAAATLAQLTDVYVRMGKLAESEPLNRQLFLQREQNLLVMARQYAANQTALGRFAEADILYNVARQIYERAWPQTTSKLVKTAAKPSAPPALLVETLEQHAQVLRKLNRKKDASRLEKQARPLREILQAQDSLTLHNNGNRQFAGAL